MLFAIWAASCVAGSTAVWALISVLGLFLIETIYSIIRRRGQEPKWFSPCIFLYLLVVVPPVWILNIDMFECFATTQQFGNGSCTGLNAHAQSCAFVSFETYFDRKPLAYTLEEIMLLLLIIGRWLLPKGNISREQLSQLLFVYFGISSDIMDIFILFQEPKVLRDESMCYAILALWSLSLFQFTIVLTAVKSRRPRLSLQATPLRKLTSFKCCQFEIWGLMTTVVMQDGPFLVLRLYCLIGLKIFSYALLFYTVKNILVVILQAYRFIVLLLNIRESTDAEIDHSQSMVSITGSSRNGKPPSAPGTPTRLVRPQLMAANHSLSNLSRGTSDYAIGSNNKADFSFESVV